MGPHLYGCQCLFLNLQSRILNAVRLTSFVCIYVQTRCKKKKEIKRGQWAPECHFARAFPGAKHGAQTVSDHGVSFRWTATAATTHGWRVPTISQWRHCLPWATVAASTRKRRGCLRRHCQAATSRRQTLKTSKKKPRPSLNASNHPCLARPSWPGYDQNTPRTPLPTHSPFPERALPQPPLNLV